MPTKQSQSLNVASLSKGLKTNQNPLDGEAGHTLVDVNCKINKDGSRERRPAMEVVNASINWTKPTPQETKVVVSDGISPYAPIHIFMEDRRLKIRYTDPSKALIQLNKASSNPDDYEFAATSTSGSITFNDPSAFDVSDDSVIDYTVSGNNIYIVNGTDKVLQITLTATSEFVFTWLMKLHDIRVRDHWSVALKLDGHDMLQFPKESERISTGLLGGTSWIQGTNGTAGPLIVGINGFTSNPVDKYNYARLANNYIYLMRNAGWDKRAKAVGNYEEGNDCLLGHGAHSFGGGTNLLAFPAIDENIGPYLGGNNANEDKYKFFPAIWKSAQEFGLGRSTGNYIISPISRGASRTVVRNGGSTSSLDSNGQPTWLYGLRSANGWLQTEYTSSAIYAAYYDLVLTDDGEGNVTYATQAPPAFNKDRTARGFTSVAAHGGRVWYGGAGGAITEPEIGQSPDLEEYIFFSRQDSVGQAGECHTVENPTQQDSAGVLATDGGFIKVSGMLGFSHFESVGKSLLVVARNGIWIVTGPDGYFRADDFTVDKVTDLGCYNKNATAIVENSLCYMSPEGVVQLSFDGSTFQPKIISDTIEAVIDRYESTARVFSDIGLESFSKLVFNKEDYALDVVVSGTTYFGPDGVPKTVGYGTNILRYSFKFQAWTEHAWGTPSSPQSPSWGPILNLYYAPDIKKVVYNYHVPVNQTYADVYGVTESSDKFATADYGTGTINARLLSPMQTFGELGREKQVTYLTVFLEVDGNTTDRSLELDYAWDWGRLEKLNQIIEPDKCYTYGELYDRDDGLFFTPEDEFGSRPASLSPVMQPNKVKLSGSGKALQFRFQNTQGRYFKLYGYTVDVTGNGRV